MGAIARLLLPGRDPIGVFGTIVVGIVGSFVGGFLENLIEHHTLSIHSFHPVGLVGSIVGAIVLLLLLEGLPTSSPVAVATDSRRNTGEGLGSPPSRPGAH